MRHWKNPRYPDSRHFEIIQATRGIGKIQGYVDIRNLHAIWERQDIGKIQGNSEILDIHVIQKNAGRSKHWLEVQNIGWTFEIPAGRS